MSDILHRLVSPIGRWRAYWTQPVPGFDYPRELFYR
jgi:hypothetical protein